MLLSRYRSVRDGAIADVGRAIAMAAGGALAFAPVEYVLTLWAYSGGVPLGSKLRLAALTGTLSLWLWLLAAIALSATLVTIRALGGYFDPEAACGPGWFVASPLDGGVRRGVPRLWAAIGTAAAFGAALQRSAAWAITHYKEPQLTSALIAVIAVVLLVLARLLHRLLAVAGGIGATALAPILGRANPLGRWRAAGAVLAALVGGAIAAIWFLFPASRSVLPVRLMISAIVFALGMGGGALAHARRGRPRPSRQHALVRAAIACVLMIGTLWQWGAQLETKYVAITASPALDQLIRIVRVANDLDGDGFGSLLGENDCAPLDGKIHPGAIDIPDDGIDQNCDGHDFSLRSQPVATGPTLPVPPQFKKDWNVLFITIDTLRYDHTTFGGYKDSPKHRDTTPRLAELVKRSTSFTFCNAPSAGTMASIPAIITSKYFHSGIALDENMPPGTPPKLKPENTLLSEIMKRAGYRTAVVASHDWWNDWGMDQGVDDYDNSIGKTPDPFRVAADKVTDHVLAWISRQQGHKWFMWAHYIDPHGRYVAHPDVIDYGSSEPDLYDAEIRWTDQQIGRLLDELVRLPSNDNTIIVITSDHGDSMGEHTVPLGTHGTALYRELQHVPMIFYIPDNTPHQIGGAVSNLDIVPTLAEILGIDVHDLSFEGKSEVPAIFYGKEDHDRIVFAETNAPQPQRAAISEAWKLIFYLHSNLYELYDLKADPWEHENLAPKSPPAMAKMQAALEQWLERVVYARDPLFNQASEKVADVVLARPPSPAVVTTGQSIERGKIEVLGLGLADNQHLKAGAKVDVHVYFAVHDPTQLAYKLMLEAWPVGPGWKPTDAMAPQSTHSDLRITAQGFFPTDRWRVNEYVRERFTLQIPPDWHGESLAFGLVAASGPAGLRPNAAGAAPANDPTVAVLGVLPFEDLQAGSSGSGRP